MMPNNCNLNCNNNNKYLIANQTNDMNSARCDHQQQQQQQQQSHFLTHYNTISDNANCVLNFNNYMCPPTQQQQQHQQQQQQQIQQQIQQQHQQQHQQIQQQIQHQQQQQEHQQIQQQEYQQQQQQHLPMDAGCSLAQNQFITNSNPQIDHEIGEKAAKKEKHQIAHRQIEKKRRDRMNNQLGRLKELLPENFIKKAKTRVEKVEIVEMAIEHLLKMNVQQTKNDSTSTSTTSLVEPQTDLLNKRGYKQGVEDGMKALLKLFKEFSKTETNILSAVAQLAKKLTSDVIETIDDEEEENLDLDTSVANLLKSRYKFANKLQSPEETPPASTSSESTCQTNAFPATPNFTRKKSSSVMFSLSSSSSSSSSSSLSNNGDTSGNSEEIEGCNEWNGGGDSNSGDSSGIVKYLNMDNQTVTKYKSEMCSRFQASQSSPSLIQNSFSCCSSSSLTKCRHHNNKRKKLDKKKKKKKKLNKKQALI